MSLPKDLSKFTSLVDIIAKLRANDGCPWDRKQTHTSLRQSLLQECYEVLEALDDGDSARLCEELGDLLMQIVLHAQIACEGKEFGLKDVVIGINTKLIHRHPHIFGEERVKSAKEVAHNWEALKWEERKGDFSLLESVSKQMPALGYSLEIQSRAAQVGFDWEDISGVIDKLAEEVNEFEREENPEQRAQEFGDLLFTLVNIGRWMNIDPESALREANKRFYHRFTLVEELCRKRDLNFRELSLKTQNALWEETKRKFE